MSNQSYLVLITTGLLVAAVPVHAEKKWQGQVLHGPVLGENFVGAKIYLSAITGRCSREFGDLLRQDLQAHGVIVISDRELTATAQEHQLQAAIPAPGGAPELARALGPTDVITVDISRCQALPREPMVGSGLPASHISRTEGHFQASLKVTDLATGKEITTLALRADPAKQNESQSTAPEYPAASEVQDLAMRQGVDQTRHLYSPWKENQELVYMDDKDCNLRQSWDLLKSGDYAGLLRAARTNAEACHAAPKTAAAAWYDLGIANMLLQNYEGALEAFHKSKALHEIGAADALGEQCQRNKALAGALARQVVQWAAEEHKSDKPAGSVKTGIIFDNDLVIRLVQGDVKYEDIIRMIGTEPNRFALGPEEIVKLQDAGVPEAIVSAMLAQKR